MSCFRDLSCRRGQATPVLPPPRCISLLGVLVSVAFALQPTRAEAQPPRTPVNALADFLVSRDIVLRGTVLGKQDVLHSRSGGPAVTGLTPVAGWLFTIRPDSVLFGSPADSVVHLFVFGRPRYDEHGDSPGQDVLVYAIRPSSDPGTYWGNILPMSPEGRIRLPAREWQSLAEPGQKDSVSLHDLYPALTQRRGRHPTVALDGASAVCLVRITTLSARPEGGYAAEVDSLDWLLGSSGRSPRRILFPALPHCRGISVGDTILVPLQSSTTESELSANHCPSAVRVAFGRIPTLACRLENLGDALGSSQGRIRVITGRRGR